MLLAVATRSGRVCFSVQRTGGVISLYFAESCFPGLNSGDSATIREKKIASPV